MKYKKKTCYSLKSVVFNLINVEETVGNENSNVCFRVSPAIHLNTT